MTLARADDLVLLISPDRKRFVVLLEPGEVFHTHRGMIAHDDLIGQPLGRVVHSHNGARFTVLRPSMEEVLMTQTRSTQIVYPKDIGYILLKLSVVPGARVIEAGSGSGVLTTALARYVTPGGHVYSYEARPEMLELARENVARVGLADAVTFRQRSIEIGFADSDVDALFLDVREPWLYLDQAVEAMADGAFFGSLVPTINQVVRLVKGLTRGRFQDIDVCELMLRKYKAVPERVRPLDRLTAHTGFLLFARKASKQQRIREEREQPQSLQTADDQDLQAQQPLGQEEVEPGLDSAPIDSAPNSSLDIDYLTDVPGLTDREP